MVDAVRRFFDCGRMIRKDQVVGEIPGTREVYRRTFEVAWPSALESVLVGLVGIIDTMMVGSIGSEAIAAVGITNQPKFVFLAIILSLNVGVTALVARRKGEGDREGANRVLRQSVVLSVILSAASCLLGLFFSGPIIRFAGAGPDILDDAVAYFRIIMTGMFFNCLLLTLNAAQRGIGKTRISMKTNLTANAVNILFNYLLIGGKWGFPRMGVRGAAAATVLGFLVGFLMSLFSVLHRDQFLCLLGRVSWRFNKQTVGGIWRVSSSSLVEQLCMRFGFFIYAMIVASLGTVAFATHQICMNIISLSFCIGDGLSIAASSLVGQSLGASRPDMAIIYGKSCQRIALCSSCGLLILFATLRRYIMMAFTEDPGIIQSGMQIMLVIAVTTLMQTSQVVLTGCLRGAGDTRFAAVISLISVAFIRPFSAWLFCYPMQGGLFGAWVSLFVDQSMRMILSFLRFRSGKWTQLKL